MFRLDEEIALLHLPDQERDHDHTDQEDAGDDGKESKNGKACRLCARGRIHPVRFYRDEDAAGKLSRKCEGMIPNRLDHHFG